MKIVKTDQAERIKNGDTCFVTEYSFNDKDINLAVVKISGRYPETGCVMNEKCKEVAFVKEGSGKVIVDDKEIMLLEGDAVFIEPGEKFYWEGNFTLVMPCTPAWEKEQYKLV